MYDEDAFIDTSHPIDSDGFDMSKTYPGMSGITASWEPVAGLCDNPQDQHDLQGYHSAKYPDQSEMYNMVPAYMHTTVTVGSSGKYDLLLGSDDWVRVWVDGTRVHSNYAWRGTSYAQDIISGG